MREFWEHTQDLLLRGGAAVAGFFHGMASGSNRSAVLLLVLIVADYLSGIVAAALGRSKKSAHGRLSSEAGWKGLLRKAMMLMVVAIAYLLDLFVNEGNAMFSTATVWFYISNEGLSLLENLALCGIPIPRRLRGMLEKLGEEEAAEEAGDETAVAKEKTQNG